MFPAFILSVAVVILGNTGKQDVTGLPGFRYVENIEDLQIDSGWQSFKFGNYSENVSDKFQFSLLNRGFLWVTDAYCKGDSFLVFDNGRIVGETVDVEEDGCKTNATDPTDAIQNGGYGHLQLNLTKGNHLLSFIVKNSPFLAGEAFLRVDSEYKIPGQVYPDPDPTSTSTATSITEPTIDPSLSLRCPISRSNLYIIDLPRNYRQANDVCNAMGLRPAKITNDNVIDAISLSFDCLGRNRLVWLGEYTISRKFRYYMIRTGEKRGEGTVFGNPNTEERVAFMCQMRARPSLF